MGNNAIGPEARVATQPLPLAPGDDNEAMISSHQASKVQAIQPGHDFRVKETGKRPNSASPSLFKSYVTEGRQELKDKGDYAIMRFFVCCGVPPTVADANEFKEVMSALNPRYQPPSSSTLTSKLIPNEAAKLSIATKNYLSTCRHLTITFDGGKTRQPHSVYTIHVTTADRRTFCMDLDDGSRLSHTAEYIFEALERVS